MGDGQSTHSAGSSRPRFGPRSSVVTVQTGRAVVAVQTWCSVATRSKVTADPLGRAAFTFSKFFLEALFFFKKLLIERNFFPRGQKRPCSRGNIGYAPVRLRTTEGLQNTACPNAGV